MTEMFFQQYLIKKVDRLGTIGLDILEAASLSQVDSPEASLIFITFFSEILSRNLKLGLPLPFKDIDYADKELIIFNVISVIENADLNSEYLNRTIRISYNALVTHVKRNLIALLKVDPLPINSIELILNELYQNSKKVTRLPGGSLAGGLSFEDMRKKRNKRLIKEGKMRNQNKPHES